MSMLVKYMSCMMQIVVDADTDDSYTADAENADDGGETNDAENADDADNADNADNIETKYNGELSFVRNLICVRA